MLTSKDGIITVSIFDLIENLDDDTRQRLAREIACDDVVFQSVAEQIVDGMDAEGFSSASVTATPEPRTPLDKARRYVAKGAGDAAEAEILRLERALASEKDSHRRSRNIIAELAKYVREDVYVSAVKAANAAT